VEQPTSISNLEEEASDLAKFLDLKLENLWDFIAFNPRMIL
jgi:hypothetical protein